MTTTYVSTLSAKEAFSELINRVAHQKENIILTRRDKPIAVLIPLEDFQLLQEIQSQSDLKEAAEALQEARTDGYYTLTDFK